MYYPRGHLDQNNSIQEIFYQVLVQHIAYFNKSHKWKYGIFVPRSDNLVLFLLTDSLKKELRLRLVKKLEREPLTIQHAAQSTDERTQLKYVTRSPRDTVILHRAGELEHDTILYWQCIYSLEEE